MKKYFVLFTLLLIAVVSNAQESITDSLGCYESSSVKFCSYKEAYLKNDMAGVVRLDEFEVSYDKLGLSGNIWLVSFKISYLCLPLFYETRTTPSCHPSGCAYRQL